MANPSTDYSTIEPYHFFSSQADKTKFNWFAFEWACEMDRAVPIVFGIAIAINFGI